MDGRTCPYCPAPEAGQGTSCYGEAPGSPPWRSSVFPDRSRSRASRSVPVPRDAFERYATFGNGKPSLRNSAARGFLSPEGNITRHGLPATTGVISSKENTAAHATACRGQATGICRSGKSRPVQHTRRNRRKSRQTWSPHAKKPPLLDGQGALHSEAMPQGQGRTD